jgi:gluconokinase
MAAAAGRVKLREAIDPLVLAVDIGSTASRGDVYDAAGRPVRGGREKVPHQFTTRDDGTSEIDPDQIVGEVQQIITALATDRRAGRIGGVALDTFASSLVGVGADRRPVRRASPTPTLGVRPRSANCDESWTSG